MCNIKSCFILVLLCLINKTRGIETTSEMKNEFETLKEHENKDSFYHYALEFPNTQSRNVGNIFQKKPRILSNFEETAPKKNYEILEELANSLATLQYQPVVVLMDDTCKALLNAEYFTNNLLNTANIHNEFWLMKFNISGVTSVLAQSRVNSEKFKNYLKNEIAISTDITSEAEGSVTFFAVLKAAQILPKKSIILLFAENKPIDEDLSQLALTNLMQKQIQLFVVWSGPHSSQGQEEKLLRETAIYSSGNFYLGTYLNMPTDCKKTRTLFSNEVTGPKEEILVKKTVHKDEKIQFPIDYTVQNLDIIIEGNFHSAILISPAGYIANLLDLVSVRRLSPGAISTHAQGNWAHVRFNTMEVPAKPVTGTWELKISGPTSDTEYNVTVYAETELTVSSKLITNGKTGYPYAAKPSTDTEIQLDVKGKISKIENISIVDNNGYEIRHIPFYFIKNMKIKEAGNTENLKLKLSNSNTTLPVDSFYVKVTGSTEQGEVFSRLSYVENNNRETREPPLIMIESSLQSNLIATAGSNPKVIFEVTNNFNRPMFVRFSVQDEKSILRDLVPRGTFIPPKGSVEVTVYTIIPASSTLQYTDLITLTAYGQVRAQKSAMLYVNSMIRTDTTLPYLNYKYTSTCMEVPYSSCQSGIWSIEVTAQDAESGLLRVVSEPAGLYSPNGYISGTKEMVTLYYSSHCCQSNLDITAIDLNNNKRSYKADAYSATLSTGSIVAIVLGVIIFIILVIIAVILIRKCCKERDSLDLPRYRGQLFQKIMALTSGTVKIIFISGTKILAS